MRKQRKPLCGTTNRMSLNTRTLRSYSSLAAETSAMATLRDTNPLQTQTWQAVKMRSTRLQPLALTATATQKPPVKAARRQKCISVMVPQQYVHHVGQSDSSRLQKIYRDKVKLIHRLSRMIGQDKFREGLGQLASQGRVAREALQDFILKNTKAEFTGYEVDNFMSYFNYDKQNKTSANLVADLIFSQGEIQFFMRAGRRVRPVKPETDPPVETALGPVEVAKLLQKKKYLSSIPSARLYSWLNPERKGYVKASEVRQRLLDLNLVQSKGQAQQIIPGEEEVYDYQTLVKRLKPSDSVYKQQSQPLGETKAFRQSMMMSLKADSKGMGRGKYSHKPPHQNTFAWMRSEDAFFGGQDRGLNVKLQQLNGERARERLKYQCRLNRLRANQTEQQQRREQAEQIRQQREAINMLSRRTQQQIYQIRNRR